MSKLSYDDEQRVWFAVYAATFVSEYGKKRLAHLGDEDIGAVAAQEAVAMADASCDALRKTGRTGP